MQFNTNRSGLEKKVNDRDLKIPDTSGLVENNRF